MKEFTFIDIVKNTLDNSSYIGDDTAFVKEKDIVVTHDTLIEDVHFRRSTISAFDLGYKSIAVNLSDLASAGSIAKYVTVSVSVPEDINEAYIKELYEGINTICNEFGVVVIGGDFTSSSKITISVSAIGDMNKIEPAARGNSNVGDYVVTTGVHGLSAAGFWLLENNIDTCNQITKSHTLPKPKLKEGKLLLENAKTTPAMMDSSDGLADALYKISKNSGVEMEIDYSLIPINENLIAAANQAEKDVFDWMFFGGEDYELVATIDAQAYDKVSEYFTIIGKVTKQAKEPKVIVNKDNNNIVIDEDTINKNSFDHFKGAN